MAEPASRDKRKSPEPPSAESADLGSPGAEDAEARPRSPTVSLPSLPRTRLPKLAATADALFATLQRLEALEAAEREDELWKLMRAGPLAVVASNLAHSDAGACLLSLWLATWKYGGGVSSAFLSFGELPEWTTDVYALWREVAETGDVATPPPLNAWIQYHRLVQEAPGLLMVADPAGYKHPLCITEEICAMIKALEGPMVVAGASSPREWQAYSGLCTPPPPFVLEFIRSLYFRPEAALAPWARAARTIVLLKTRRSEALESLGATTAAAGSDPTKNHGSAEAAGLLEANAALVARTEAVAALAAASQKLADADLRVCRTRAAAVALATCPISWAPDALCPG